MVYFVPLKRSFAQPQPMGCGLCASPRRADRNNARDEAKNAVQASTDRSCVLGRFAGRVSESSSQGSARRRPNAGSRSVGVGPASAMPAAASSAGRFDRRRVIAPRAAPWAQTPDATPLPCGRELLAARCPGRAGMRSFPTHSGGIPAWIGVATPHAPQARRALPGDRL